MTDEANRPDSLDNTYRQFHDGGERVAWWPAGGYWFVAGYDEVAEAARDDVTYSSHHDIPNGLTRYTGVMVPPTPVKAIPIELEPGEHGLYRRLISPRFKPAAVKRREPEIRSLVRSYLEAHADAGRIDLFHDLVKLVPAVVTLDLLGLPRDDAAVIADAVHLRGPSRFVLSKVWTKVIEQILQRVVARRREPTDDLISDLANGTVGEQPIDEATIVKVCLTMVIGGMSTTAKAGVGALWYLGEHPEEKRYLCDDPSAIPVAVDEFLRYFSPVPFLSRTATRDTTLGGTEIRAGDRLALGWGAANRDPRAFPNPNEIDIRRAPNHHLAMGIGAHYCLGASLGKLELVVMLEEVLSAIPEYRLSEEVDIHSSLTVRPQALPVTFPPLAEPATTGAVRA